MTTEELVRHLRTVQTSLHLGYYQDVRAARLLVEMLLRELPGHRLTRTTFAVTESDSLRDFGNVDTPPKKG